MKKQLLGLMTILAVLGACQKNEVTSLSEDVTIHATIENEDATKTVMDENNNILWSENDQIVAFMKSSYGHKYQVKPSFVGKSFADFSMVSSGNSSDLSAGNEWDHNVVYYPYSEDIECLKSGSNYELEVNLPSEQVYVPDSFANSSMAMVTVSESNNITFKNVLGGIKLQLKGTQKVKSIKIEGKNSEKLSGAATVTAYTDETKPAITMASGASTSVTLNCGEGVQLNESTATEFIISLPPVLFSQGFTVTVADTESKTYTVETDKANTVLRSSILVMPTIIISDEITEEGEDTPTVKVLEIAFDKSNLTLAPTTSYTIATLVVPDTAEDKTLTWYSSAPAIASVDQYGKVTAISDGTATVTAVAVGGASKSCVINVISIPTSTATADYIDEYGINHGKGIAIGGTVWAPVNCGYKAPNIEEEVTTDKGYPYGKLYQWGRKYGQGYSEDYDSEPALFRGPVSVTIGQDKSMSDYFFYVPYPSSNWVETIDNSMWNGGTEGSPVKTDNDPCPTGWRVPTYDELDALSNKYSWTTNDLGQSGYSLSGYALPKYDTTPLLENVSPVFFPAAGYQSSDGGAVGRGNNHGSYWSSKTDASHGHRLDFSRTELPDMGYLFRASGCSVRCVQE